MAQTKPVLYSYFRSSCSWRVRIALLYKGIDFEYRAVNLLKDEQLTEEFQKINPLSTIPVLVHNGNAISTSAAILEYLEETVPGQPLLPKDPVARARVRTIVDGILSGIQPIQNIRILRYIGEGSDRWAKHWVEVGFSAIEKLLERTRGKFCVGDQVTLADVCLLPQVFNANRFNVDMTQYPIIQEISARLEELPFFKDSHPLVQPDCPENLKR